MDYRPPARPTKQKTPSPRRGSAFDYLMVPSGSSSDDLQRSYWGLLLNWRAGDRSHNCALAGLPGRLPMENHSSIKGLDRQLLERVAPGDQIPRTATRSGGRSQQISFR
jgi:hypothetical protein